MNPFGMSSIDYHFFLQNHGKTIYASVGSSNNYGSTPSAAGLSYHQGYMNGRSTTGGYDSLTSGEFGSTVGSIGSAYYNGTMNSYNNGYMKGVNDR